MKIAEIKKSVEAIDTAKADYEVAHNMEDALHIAVLTAIAEGKYKTKAEMVEAATVAIRTTNIKFARHCA